MGGVQFNTSTPWGSMGYLQECRELFFEHRGVKIFHAYKDEFSDIPLDFWYCTSASAPADSTYEFDVRDLPHYAGDPLRASPDEHATAIKAAIDAGLLRSEAPFGEDAYD